MSESDHGMDKTIKSMHRKDVFALVLAEVILIGVLIFVLNVVLAIAPDTTARVIAICASAFLAVASSFGVIAVIQHLGKNHEKLYREDIECHLSNLR